jgi:anti-sigma B factor antagonist
VSGRDEPNRRPDSDVRIVPFDGELDAYDAPGVRRRLQQAIEDEPRPAVLVADLQRVTFLDSTILGALVGAQRRMRERGGELRIVYPSPPADRIFTLTGLDAVFPAQMAPPG